MIGQYHWGGFFCATADGTSWAVDGTSWEVDGTLRVICPFLSRLRRWEVFRKSRM